MMRRVVLLLVSLLLAACEDTKVPMSDLATDTAGKQFAAPAPGRAALYVAYGDTRGWTPFAITLDQSSLGTLGKLTWLRVDVAPGAHDLRCTPAGQAPSSLALQLAAGQTTYVRATYSAFAGSVCQLAPVPPESGRADVLARTRIRETGGAGN